MDFIQIVRRHGNEWLSMDKERKKGMRTCLTFRDMYLLRGT